MRSRLAPWVPAAIWAAVLFFVSSQPDLGVDLGSGRDKAAHFAAYFVLGILLTRGSFRAGFGVALAITLALLYGATDELHQSTVPGRTMEFGDWLADALGAIAGVLTYLITRKYAREHALPTLPAKS